MRIAYVITRADAVGGASIHVRDLARGVREQGHEPCVFIGGTGPVTDQLEAEGVRYVALRRLQRAIRPDRDFLAYLELKDALARFQPTLVSAHTAKAGWLGRKAAHALGIPAVYTPHGLPIGDRLGRVQGLVYTVAERIAAPWARAIVCVSEAERHLALSRHIASADKFVVIHNGVRDSPLRATPARDSVQIICVARFEPPKDHATLFEALSQLTDLRWELVLVGEGPLEASLRTHSVASRARFLGAVANPAPLLAQSQIFVLSSRSEGFPRSILEAMRAGLPVIASNVGGIAEAVEHDTTGLLVPPQSPEAMAEALRTLISEPLKRQRFGSAAHLRYQERFRFETLLSRTLRLYATIVGDSNPAFSD